jgi:hypothetical protein
MMTMTDDVVRRVEYDQFARTYEIRHSELRLEIKELETDLKGQMQNMNGKMDTLSNQISSRGMDAWKLVATSSISLICGYLLYYAQHFFIR